MKKYITCIAFAALALTACEPEFENSVKDEGFYTNAEVDFTTYVAVGNSLTAGYADGALYIEGQKNSFPNILAQQFARVGGGDFKQPLMADNLGGMILSPNKQLENRFILKVDKESVPYLFRVQGTPTTVVSDHLTGPFNNMGVPGAKSFHLLAPGYGNIAGLATKQANPYYVRFASSPNASVIADAMAQNPTFFTLWIGANDVLSFATSGGVGVDQTGNMNPATYGGNDITDPTVFGGVYNQLVTTLTSKGAKGVLINIPDVRDTPYFTRVPANPVPLEATTAAALNQQFAGYNTQILPALVAQGVITQAEADLRKISFEDSQTNYLTIHDESLTDLTQILQASFNLPAPTAELLGQLRQTNDNDLVVLTASNIIGTMVNGNPQLVNGVSVPLADKWVLTTTEQSMIATATAAYNTTIETIAQANGLAFLDANALLDKLASEGITTFGVTLTDVFASGGAFSLDGIHLTPRGYALVANRILKEINTSYSTKIPLVNIATYRTVAMY